MLRKTLQVSPSVCEMHLLCESMCEWKICLLVLLLKLVEWNSSLNENEIVSEILVKLLQLLYECTEDEMCINVLDENSIMSLVMSGFWKICYDSYRAPILLASLLMLMLTWLAVDMLSDTWTLWWLMKILVYCYCCYGPLVLFVNELLFVACVSLPFES